MWLIATDEAGYGPKLGPLVITATTWWLEDDVADPLPDAFAAFAKPVVCDGVTVRVDDSKAIFKPASSKEGLSRSSPSDLSDIPVGLRSLHLAVSAASAMAGVTACRFPKWLSETAGVDLAVMSGVPWFESLAGSELANHRACRDILDAWGQSPARLRAIHTKVITARQFNQFCGTGRNKADLLSRATLALVRQATLGCPSNQNAELSAPIQVYCDRHGGRRYYAGVLQHVWNEQATGDDSDANGSVAVKVLEEAKYESRYRLSEARQDVDVRFTVKGDRFTPVAMSSLIAKYVRERLMGRLNQYFRDYHRSESQLRPTAGYPVDADRFLADVEPVIKQQGIDQSDLVRCR